MLTVTMMPIWRADENHSRQKWQRYTSFMGFSDNYASAFVTMETSQV